MSSFYALSKQNEIKKKKILVTGSTSPRSTTLTVRAVPSPCRLLGSRDHENYTGPTKCLWNSKSHFSGEKSQNRLSETSKISRGSTMNQKVPQRFKIPTSMFFLVPLETELKLECGKERKSLTFFFFFRDKIASDGHPILGEESEVSLLGLTERG